MLLRAVRQARRSCPTLELRRRVGIPLLGGRSTGRFGKGGNASFNLSLRSTCLHVLDIHSERFFVRHRVGVPRRGRRQWRVELRGIDGRRRLCEPATGWRIEHRGHCAKGVDGAISFDFQNRSLLRRACLLRGAGSRGLRGHCNPPRRRRASSWRRDNISVAKATLARAKSCSGASGEYSIPRLSKVSR